MIYRLAKAPNKLDATVTLPGSKSESNRALILAALSGKSVELRGVSPSADSESVIKALGALGVEFESDAERLIVTPPSGGLKKFIGEINVGHAGTAMRFLTALVSFIPGAEVTLSGSQRMHDRPIGDLVNALRSLGAEIEYLGKEGCPPLKIKGVKPASSGEVSLSGSVSSQYISALCLVAPMFSNGLKISITSELVSKSYLDMTISMLKRYGLNASHKDYKEIKVSGAITKFTQEIEPDASGASYFWGLAALAKGSIKVKINPDSVQGDVRFAQILKIMGCSISQAGNFIQVAGGDTLSGCSVDMNLMPDTAQTLAVIAAFADGDTTITGLSTLKSKETDRLLALKSELARAGISSQITNDSITIRAGKPKAVRFKTYDDHRMAMSFSLFSARLDGIEIENPMVVQKSFPGFWEELIRLGVKIEEVPE